MSIKDIEIGRFLRKISSTRDIDHVIEVYEPIQGPLPLEQHIKIYGRTLEYSNSHRDTKNG